MGSALDKPLAFPHRVLKPYQVEKDKLKAVNKIMKRHALWSEKRSTGGGDGERRKSKKIKSEPA